MRHVPFSCGCWASILLPSLAPWAHPYSSLSAPWPSLSLALSWLHLCCQFQVIAYYYGKLRLQELKTARHSTPAFRRRGKCMYAQYSALCSYAVQDPNLGMVQPTLTLSLSTPSKAMKTTPTDDPMLNSSLASPDGSRLCQVDKWRQPS